MQAKFHWYISSRCRTVKATTDAARGVSPEWRLRTPIAEGGRLAAEGGRRAAEGGAPAAEIGLHAAEGGVQALGRRRLWAYGPRQHSATSGRRAVYGRIDTRLGSRPSARSAFGRRRHWAHGPAFGCPE